MNHHKYQTRPFVNKTHLLIKTLMVETSYEISFFEKTTLCWTLSWCIPTNPVVHRSALFTLVNSDKADDDVTFNEILEEQDVSTLINRRNASGNILLHQACLFV